MGNAFISKVLGNDTTAGSSTNFPPGYGSAGGYTCQTCGAYVMNNLTHNCPAWNTQPYTDPYTQTTTCGLCGMKYATGSVHYCAYYTSPPPTGTGNSNAILAAIKGIVDRLDEMKKRLDNIEKILDDEL